MPNDVRDFVFNFFLFFFCVYRRVAGKAEVVEIYTI